MQFRVRAIRCGVVPGRALTPTAAFSAPGADLEASSFAALDERWEGSVMQYSPPRQPMLPMLVEGGSRDGDAQAIRAMGEGAVRATESCRLPP